MLRYLDFKSGNMIYIYIYMFQYLVNNFFHELPPIDYNAICDDNHFSEFQMSIVFCVGQWKLIGKMARELLECLTGFHGDRFDLRKLKSVVREPFLVNS